LSGADGIPVTVVTLKGESIKGTFLGASGAEVQIETSSRLLTLQLRDVSYISFVGRPTSAETVSYALPATPSSQLRTEGFTHESAGRLDEALRKYEEAAKLDPNDPLTIRALDRVRRRISAQEAARKSAAHKKLAVELRDAGRYGEAAACYDEALRLDPNDKKFREQLAPMRHYWQPTTCPISAQPAAGR
jgi:tetratricopeptide (TPR) repeat protein